MKCIISDFDGTLYDSNFKRNIESIKEFVLKGNVFIINTGRTYNSIQNALKDYSIPYKYLICSDGACIYNKNGEIIYNKYMDDELKNNLIEYISNDYNVNEIMFDDNYTVISNNNEMVSRVLIKRTNDEEHDKKMVLNLNKNFNVKAYLSSHWIDILDKKNNKMVAIQYLKENEDLGTIYTIGDSINDIEMLLNYNGYLMKQNDIEEDYNLKLVESVEVLIEQLKKD